MRRSALAVPAAAVAATAIAALAVAASAGGTGSADRSAVPKKKSPLPQLVKQRRRWRVGVKCDSPPFGYMDSKGHHAGYDVDIARWFSRFAFGRGNRVSFTCVTTASRLPTLTEGKIDLILATLTFTRARAHVVDFSTPYYTSTGRMLVPNASSLRLRSIAGRTIATTGGSVYDRWLNKCFPNTHLLLLDTPSLALQAVKDGRADAEMYDDSLLLGVATSDPTVRLTQDKFLELPWGIGIAKGNVQLRNWVNSKLAILKKRNLFVKILKHNARPTIFRALRENVPGPRRTLHYPPSEEAELLCP